MFQAHPAPPKAAQKMVEIIWVQSEVQEPLGAIAAPLWTAMQRSISSSGLAPKRAEYSMYLERGAKDLALRALSQRNRSRQWVFEKLVSFEVPKTIADRISREMAQKGYASDSSLKGRIISEAERRGRGIYWVKKQLWKHRVVDGDAKPTTSLDLSKEVEAISRWLELHTPPLETEISSAQRYKIFQRFLRRGYLVQSIEDALANWQKQ